MSNQLSASAPTTVLATPDALSIAQRVISDRPIFHTTDRDTGYAPKGAPVRWNAQPETLRWIAREVRPGQTTLETGAGASSVVFAATGAKHITISPPAAEHARIREYCERVGVSTAGVTFMAESSDRVLPSLEPDARFDVVLLDSTHAFPYAIVEWHFVRHHIEAGGLLLLDDVPIPAVNVLYRFLRADPCWREVAVVDRRTVGFRKIAEEGEVTWRDQPFNSGYPQLGFLPPLQRGSALLRHWHRATRNGLAGNGIARRLTGKDRR